MIPSVSAGLAVPPTLIQQVRNDALKIAPKIVIDGPKRVHDRDATGMSLCGSILAIVSSKEPTGMSLCEGILAIVNHEEP